MSFKIVQLSQLYQIISVQTFFHLMKFASSAGFKGRQNFIIKGAYKF